MAVGWIDLTLIILFAIAWVVGYSNGFVSQLTSLCAILVAILAVWVGGSSATDIVAKFMGVDGESTLSHFSAAVVGCGLLFILTWFCVWFLGRTLTKTLNIVRLGFVNNIGGALFMMFKYLIVISLVLNLWQVVAPTSSVFYSSRLLDGRIFQGIMDFCPWLLGYLHLSATKLLTPAL